MYLKKITTKIEHILKRKLRPSMNPAKMMEYSKAKAGAIARTFVMSSAIDEAGNPVGKSLQEVLKADREKRYQTIYSLRCFFKGS